MEKEKNNNKSLIAVLVVIIVILLALVILLATGTVSFKSVNNADNTVTNNNTNSNTTTEINGITPNDTDDMTTNNTDDYSTDVELFPVENGYTEVVLNSNQRKEINDKLLMFNVEYSLSMFPSYYNAKIGDDLYSSDCAKIGVAYGYVWNKLNGRIADEKYSIDGYYQKNGNDYTFDINKIKALARMFFNKDIVCNEQPYDKDISFHNTGGGWASTLLKTVSKYQSGNNYYLILHLYTYSECRSTNTCYDIDDNPTIEGNYFKLKYYKDNTKEYLISLEYLK